MKTIYGKQLLINKNNKMYSTYIMDLCYTYLVRGKILLVSLSLYLLKNGTKLNSEWRDVPEQKAMWQNWDFHFQLAQINVQHFTQTSFPWGEKSIHFSVDKSVIFFKPCFISVTFHSPWLNGITYFVSFFNVKTKTLIWCCTLLSNRRFYLYYRFYKSINIDYPESIVLAPKPVDIAKFYQ